MKGMPQYVLGAVLACFLVGYGCAVQGVNCARVGLILQECTDMEIEGRVYVNSTERILKRTSPGIHLGCRDLGMIKRHQWREYGVVSRRVDSWYLNVIDYYVEVEDSSVVQIDSTGMGVKPGGEYPDPTRKRVWFSPVENGETRVFFHGLTGEVQLVGRIRVKDGRVFVVPQAGAYGMEGVDLE